MEEQKNTEEIGMTVSPFGSGVLVELDQKDYEKAIEKGLGGGCLGQIHYFPGQ